MADLPDIARPANQEALPEGMVYAAVKQFCYLYGQPAINPDNIFQGYQNRISKPQGTNEYIVIVVIGDYRRATTTEDFILREDDPSTNWDIIDIRSLNEILVQVDCYSDTDLARQRCSRIATVCRSMIGVQHFKDYGCSAWYADDVLDTTIVDDNNQYVRRYTTTLHLSVYNGDRVDFQSFERVGFNRFENVDVHHPVRNED